MQVLQQNMKLLYQFGPANLCILWFFFAVFESVKLYIIAHEKFV